MANTLKVKRSAVAGKIPATTDIALGELAINTNDGKLFFKKSVGGVESIVDATAGGYTLPAATSSVLGGVKGFSNLTIDGAGNLSMASGNVVSALGYTPSNAAHGFKGIGTDYGFNTGGAIPANKMGGYIYVDGTSTSVTLPHNTLCPGQQMTWIQNTTPGNMITINCASSPSQDYVFFNGGSQTSFQLAYMDAVCLVQAPSYGWHLVSISKGTVGGRIQQAVSAIKTDQWAAAVGSPADFGLSASITTQYGTSRVMVMAAVQLSTSGGGGDGYVRLMRDGTSIGNGNAGYFGQTAGQDYFQSHSKVVTFIDSPGKGSFTYKCQAWGANVTYVNGRGYNGDFVTSSTLTLLEISG